MQTDRKSEERPSCLAPLKPYRSIPASFCSARVTRRKLYIVRKGLLWIVSGGTVYETVRTGDIVGEMGIVEPGARRSASVIADTHAELVKIDRPKFLALVANTPDFSLEVMQVIARRLRIMNVRYRHERL